MMINYIWSVNNSLDKLRAFDGLFNSVDNYAFSYLYTTLPFNFIEKKFKY